jgi:CHAT domain-containing protein
VRWTLGLGVALGAALLCASLKGPARADVPGGADAVCRSPGASGSPPQAADEDAAAALERGAALEAQGDPAAALDAYDESRRLALERGDSWLATLARANRARAAIAAGRQGGVEFELDAVAAAADAFPDEPGRARLLIHVGRSYALLAAERPASGAALTRAAAILSRAAEVAERDGRARDRSYALGYLGEIYERKGRADEAMDLSRRAVLAALEANASDALYRWQWQLGRIHRAAGRPAQALYAYRQAAATLDRLRQQAALASAAWSASSGRSARQLYVELVDLLLREAARSADPGQTHALLTEVRDTLEAGKAEELRDYFRDECLAAQRKAVPDEIPGAVVVYPVVLPDRVEILVGGAGKLERFVAPIERDVLTREVHAFRAKLTRRTTREYLRHSYTLYDWLIRPIDAALRAREPETLVFVPDGPLRTIPFAALRDRESGDYLIERYPVAIVPSLTLTEPRPIEQGRVRLLAAGISEPVGGFPGLAAVSDEIEALSETYRGETLLNDQFVVARFASEVEGRPFGIVHIASHGEFSEDPSQSFLLAYDGKLSMNRLAQLVGTTRFRQEQPLELLMLSACETAAGDERAALGLAGIALRAGARSALATLWSVNDQASANLVVAFYGGLSQGELSRAQALQRAQLELIGHRGYRHPAFWSPFVLISSWL